MKRALATLVLLWSAAARADESSGYIGETKAALAIDNCPVIDSTLGADQRVSLAREHYDRGGTLYEQGDYTGTVTEFTASYCLSPYYGVLKTIALAFERNLDYEQTIGYLERYIQALPADQRDERTVVAHRIEVLRRLPAHVFVETDPKGARITIGNDAGVEARGTAGDQLLVSGGAYSMLVELPGYKPETRPIEVRIGKPYAYFVKLVAEKGELSVQVTPPEARIFIGDRYAGTGHIAMPLDASTYTILSEAPDRVSDRRVVEVLPNQVRRVQVELTPQPQFGRRQLVVFSTATGVFSGFSLLYAFKNTGIAGAAALAGGATGLAGSYFYLPRDLSLGTSNLTITTTLAGGIAGFSGSLMLTGREEVIVPIAGATALIGGALGYYAGNRIRIRPGDAALINSGVVWGTAAGALFAAAFDPTRLVGGGLVLTGFSMGTVGGVLLARYYTVSRTHVVLIDVGGVVGLVGGLAIESLVYPTKKVAAGTTASDVDAQTQEHLANFALGGMAVGLVLAGIVTRNFDAPKVPVQPALGRAVAVDGSVTTTFGVAGAW